MAERLNIVVPVKGLRDGKSRLSGVLAGDERVELNRFLAKRTLGLIETAFPEADRWVVSPDPAIRKIAEWSNTGFIAQSGTGLNEGLAEAAAAVAPVRTVYIAADLPELSAEDIVELANVPGIAIAPDERASGTNALSFPLPGSIGFGFGPGSLYVHIGNAAATGLAVEIVKRPGLMLDLDTKDDLSRLKGWPWEDDPRRLNFARGEQAPSQKVRKENKNV